MLCRRRGRGIPAHTIEGTCGEQDPDFFCCFVVFDVRLRRFDASLGRLSGIAARFRPEVNRLEPRHLESRGPVNESS